MKFLISFDVTGTLRAIYWSVARDPRRSFHLIRIMGHTFITLVALLLRRHVIERKPTVAIALVEHLGDIVAAEPIARLARTQFPASTILWIVRPAYASIPPLFGSVSRVVPVLCLTEWALLRNLGVFDVVWDLHVPGRVCPTCSIPHRSYAGVPAGFDINTYFRFGNLLTVHCISAGIPVPTTGTRLRESCEATNRLEQYKLPDNFIIIHCASNEERKNWPTEKWEALLHRLSECSNISVIEIGLATSVIKTDTALRRSLCGQLSIVETAELIRRARLFIGVDSGPAHLANAVGTPAVLLFGTYRGFPRYMPYSGGFETGEQADMIWADGPIQELEVEPVISAVRARLSASRILGMKDTSTQA